MLCETVSDVASRLYIIAVPQASDVYQAAPAIFTVGLLALAIAAAIALPRVRR